MTILLTVLTVLLPLTGLMVCPPKHLPNYRRGGWGKYAR
jgi:hypothetical protein